MITNYNNNNRGSKHSSDAVGSGTNNNNNSSRITYWDMCGAVRGAVRDSRLLSPRNRAGTTAAPVIMLSAAILMAGVCMHTESPIFTGAYAQTDNNNAGDDKDAEMEERAERAKIERQDPIITINIDKPEYRDGDVIIISGEIATRLADTPVILQIFKDNNPIYINQITPAADNTYWDVVRAEGAKWERDGEYKISIRYGTDGKASTEFNFTPGSAAGDADEQPVTDGHFEVDAGNETFDILYSVAGGAVITDMILDWRDFTLVVEIDTQGASETVGYVTLDMPRKYIGSEKVDGNRVSDEVFIILVDGVQSPYEEVPTNPAHRKIKVDIAGGDSEIRIIGTYAVPEFGQIVIITILLAGGMLGTVIISRMRSIGLAASPGLMHASTNK